MTKVVQEEGRRDSELPHLGAPSTVGWVKMCSVASPGGSGSSSHGKALLREDEGKSGHRGSLGPRIIGRRGLRFLSNKADIWSIAVWLESLEI